MCVSVLRCINNGKTEFRTNSRDYSIHLDWRWWQTINQMRSSLHTFIAVARKLKGNVRMMGTELVLKSLSLYSEHGHNNNSA